METSPRARAKKQTNARSLSKDNTHVRKRIYKKDRTKGLGGFMIVAHASLMDIPLAFARVNRFAFSGWCAKIYSSHQRERENVSSSSAFAKPHAKHVLNTRNDDEEFIRTCVIKKLKRVGNDDANENTRSKQKHHYPNVPERAFRGE